jgi:molecular chaperone DnaK (HSP70)
VLVYLQVTTEEERNKFTEQLSEAEDWLYGDGEAAGASEFKERLSALQAVGKPIEVRASEAELRPEVSLVGSDGLGWVGLRAD